MNWSKAKTILIVALILVNGFFFASLYKKETDGEGLASKTYLNQMEETLLTEGITIDTDVPLDSVGLVPLNVQYQMLDERDLNKNFFKNEGTIIPESDSIIIQHAEGQIELYNDGRLEYTRADSGTNNLTEDEANKELIKTLDEMGLDSSDLNLYYSEFTKEGYKLDYSATYMGIYLEDSKVHALVDDKGVKKLSRYWLDVMDSGEKEMTLSPSSKALLELLNIEEAYNKKIIDIEEAYYFKDIEHPDIEDGEEVLKGKTIPAWRIQFQDGTVVIIGDYRR